VKHRRVRGRHAYLDSRRKYRVTAVSAAFLAVAAVTGALMDPSGTPQAGTAELPVVAAQAAMGAQMPQAEAPRPSPPTVPGRAAPPSTPPPSAQPSNPDVKPTPAPPAEKVLDYTYEGQPNGYYCGPAATRIALTARKLFPSQDDVANRLNTTVNGTDSSNDTTRVLNDLIKTDFYRTREIPNGEATPAEMDRLQADAVHAISNGYAIVANIAGETTDTDGGWHSYPGGHYVTIVGYQDSGRQVKIADPANPSVSSYWMTTIDMANWMATRGYSA
jgi:hypothetical protein